MLIEYKDESTEGEAHNTEFNVDMFPNRLANGQGWD